MSKLTKKIVKNTSYLTIGNQIANLLQFSFFLYFGRLFGEAAVGQYSFGFSFTYTFIIFADLGISLYLIREVACDKTGSRSLIFEGLVLRVMSLVFVMLIAIVVFPLISKDFPAESIHIIGFLCLYQVLFSLSEVFTGELKGREEMGVVALLAIILKATIVIGGFTAIALGLPYYIVLIAFPIGGLVNLMVCIFISRLRLGPLTIQFNNLRHYYRLFLKALPFGSALLLHQGINSQDIIILRFLSGDVSVGNFCVAVKIVGFISGMYIFLYETLLPIFTNIFLQSPENLIAVSRQLLKYLLIITLPIAVGLIMCADKIIILLFEEKFSGSIIALRIIGVTVFVSIIQVLFSAILTAIGKQSVKAVCWGINLLICIVLNLILIHFFDYIGASIVRAFSEILTTVLFICLVARYLDTLPLFQAMVKPGLACASMAIFIYVASTWNLALIILVSALLYFISLLFLGTFTKEEIISVKKNLYSKDSISSSSI